MNNIETIAHLAVTSLVDEAMLTPKPGLVDLKSSGSHGDMSIEIMLRSAYALQKTFVEIAKYSFLQQPSQRLRETLAEIGRRGEQDMFRATGGVNTHKGAIWAVGLLVAGAAINMPVQIPHKIAETAGAIARYPDRWAPAVQTNGLRMQRQYQVTGASGEAQQAFPHVMDIALPELDQARGRGIPEAFARLDSLIALIAHVDDTCILHRGGKDALTIAKEKAHAVLIAGGTSTKEGRRALKQLDQELLARNSSPGGSADLLAATLFIDRLRKVKWFDENDNRGLA